MALDKMTVVVSSFRRREPLLRLLRGLDQQLAQSADLRHDLQVVVVLDGSTDGSQRAVDERSWSVPVEVVWQPNRGLAAARNAGLSKAAGGLVWFLDDDLVPDEGLVERHRRAHRSGTPAVLVGPCRVPPDSGAPEPYLRWWDDFYDDMGTGEGAVITRFDRFTAANASGPARLFSAVGGFDESLVGYGLEDYEMGFRLLESGTLIRFDPKALAWHPEIPTRGVMVRRQRDIGRNAARIANLHPSTIDVLFPEVAPSPPRRLIRRLRLRRPGILMAMSVTSHALCRVTAAVHPPTSRRAEHLARAAAHAAGVSEGDPEGILLDRVLSAS